MGEEYDTEDIGGYSYKILILESINELKLELKLRVDI